MGLFCCTGSEVAMKKRFEEAYAKAMTPTMRAIERRVCGCDFGGNSWTTREQADAMIPLLGLGSSSTLLDLGAGTGWPGLYLAQQSGCHATLVDLPEIGLQFAERRAVEDGIADRVATRVADAADLPFADNSFDAVSHSDLLCCLVRKRAVLEQCHRILRAHGRMAFTVISLAPGLSRSAHARALDTAPEFIEAGARYGALLQDTGWRVIERYDLTNVYRDCCAQQIDTDCEYRTELAELFGAHEAKARLSNWRSKLQTIKDGLFVRELFVCKAQGQPELNKRETAMGQTM